MAVERRFHGATSSSAIIGAAFYWAWVDTFLFTPRLFVPFGAPTAFFVIGSVVAIITDCAVLLISAYKPDSIRSFLHMRTTMVSLGFAAIIGNLLTLWGSQVQSIFPIIIGGFIEGLVFGLGLIAWGEICATGGARTTSIHIPAAFALGVVFDLAIMFTPLIVSIGTLLILPIASFLILTTLRKHPEDFEEPEAISRLLGKESVNPLGGKSKNGHRRIWFGINSALVISLIIFGVAFGYMQHQSVFGSLNVFDSQLLLIVRGGTALIFFIGTCFLNWKPYITYRVGMAIMIAGFMILPFAAQIQGLAGFSGSIVMAGYTCFDIMVWSILAELAFCSPLAPECTIGAGRCLLHFGVATGMTLGVCFAVLPLSSVITAVITTSVGYLLVIAVILLISDQYGLWSLMRYGSMYSEETTSQKKTLSTDDKASILSARFNLTVREHDVLSLLLAGRSARYIAEQIYVSENTVNSHTRHIYEKLDIHNRQELFDIAEKVETLPS